MIRFPVAVPAPLHFQRGDGRLRVKKPAPKFALRLRHVVYLLGGAALFFFAAFELYSFVITWPKLEVRSVQVACSDPSVRSLVQETAGSARWGNILLLDLNRARRDMEAIPWVKEARTRKVFPSALSIEVVARRPAALLVKESLYLVDEDGHVIEQAGRDAMPDLPLFVDTGRFVLDLDFKVQRAFACLNDLPQALRAQIDSLDLSDPSDVVLRFRGVRTRLHLGDDHFGDRVLEYLEHKEAWEREAGELDYVILWFAERIVYRPFPAEAAAPGGAGTKPAKETP